MISSQPTIALVAGEASGDQLGGAILNRLKQRHPTAKFVGIGGDLMRAEGMETWWDYQELAVMGLFEVLQHFPRLLKLRNKLRQRLLDLKPDVFIGIDAPDFNLGLEIALKRRDISTIHYVSPTVWAWREKRVKKISRAADLVLCLFPFEPEYYQNQNVAAAYVGHPMADHIKNDPDPQRARQKLGLEPMGTLVALLPGSRSSEVSKLAGPMIEAAQIMATRRPDLRFVSAMANSRVRALFETELQSSVNTSITLVDGNPLEVIAASDVVLVASGTAALETMLINRPMVVCYRLSQATYLLAKMTRMIKTKFISLPNILAAKRLVPELIQHEANGLRLAEEALDWLDDSPRRATTKAQFAKLHVELQCNAGEKAAEAISALIEKPA